MYLSLANHTMSVVGLQSKQQLNLLGFRRTERQTSRLANAQRSCDGNVIPDTTNWRHLPHGPPLISPQSPSSHLSVDPGRPSIVRVVSERTGWEGYAPTAATTVHFGSNGNGWTWSIHASLLEKSCHGPLRATSGAKGGQIDTYQNNDDNNNIK